MQASLDSLLPPSFLNPALCVCGAVFVLAGEAISPERVASDVDGLYNTAKHSNGRRWPSWLTQFYLVPIYCAPSFSEPLKRWLHLYGYGFGNSRPRMHRLNVVTAPVLYNHTSNVVEFMVALQNDNASYYRVLDDLRETGLTAAAEHFGHKAESIRTYFGQYAFASQWRADTRTCNRS